MAEVEPLAVAFPPPPEDIRRRRSCNNINEFRSGVSGMDTLGGICCSNSFILGTRLTGLPPLEVLPPPPLLVLLLLPVKSRAPLGAGGLPGGNVGEAVAAKGGADSMEVRDGAEAANEDIFGLVICCCCFCC